MVAVQKVNRKFNARHMCNQRCYEYWLPQSQIGGAPAGLFARWLVARPLLACWPAARGSGVWQLQQAAASPRARRHPGCCGAGLKGDGGEEDARALEALREALRCYVGTHPFHNFTPRQAIAEPKRQGKRKKREQSGGRGAAGGGELGPGAAGGC